MNALLIAAISLCLWMTPVRAHHVPGHVLAADAVAIVSVSPSTLPSGATVFRLPDREGFNRLNITFNQPVATHTVEVTDANGCKVDRDSVADGEKITIRMKACAVVGYPPGHMIVRWTVNGVKGEHHLHMLKHH